MKTITPIAEFIEGEKIQGFYLCVEKHLRHTRSGDLYLELQLRDRSGSVNAKLWDKVEELGAKFAAGDPVAVSGQVEQYNQRLQLIIKKINRASIQHYARYGYDPGLIVPTSDRDPKELWKTLTRHIRRMKNPDLRRLVSNIYRRRRDRLLFLPASMSIHHNYRGGYLEHVLSMVEIAVFLADHYRLDRDLLLTGVLLHDIGKVDELQGEFSTEYSDEGNFIGHIVSGNDIVRDGLAAQENFPRELALKVRHMVLAHQGTHEWGSPRKPVFREALVLHLIDNLDAKLNLLERIVDDDPNAGNWTDLRNYFRTALFKGDDGSDKTG